MRTLRRIDYWAGVGIALLAPLAGEVTAGQRSNNTPSSVAADAKGSWPQINLNVVALDESGDPDETLASTDFHLFEDSSERPIQSVAASDSPVSIAFLIDASGSTYMHRGMYTEVVKVVAHALPAGSEVMAVSFADQAHLALPFTPVSSADLSFLDRLDSRSTSALFDAVISTEHYLSEHARYAKRALVLLSDGGDDASKSSREEVFRCLQSPGAPESYMFVIPSSNPDDSAHGTRILETIAKASGGIAFPADRKVDMEMSAARLAAMIRSQQVFAFTAADPSRDGKAHKLEMRLVPKDLHVHAMPLYYAPENKGQ